MIALCLNPFGTSHNDNIAIYAEYTLYSNSRRKDSAGWATNMHCYLSGVSFNMK